MQSRVQALGAGSLSVASHRAAGCEFGTRHQRCRLLGPILGVFRVHRGFPAPEALLMGRRCLHPRGTVAGCLDFPQGQFPGAPGPSGARPGGTFGAISTSSNGLRNANIEFDTSPAVQVQRPLTGKSVRERKRLFGATRTTYLLEYREWFGDLGYRSIAVPAATYEQASNGDYLEFEQHQGYFGWRWARFKAWRPQPAT
jgi:hypothetical protein